MIAFENFAKVFPSNFTKKLRESIIPYDESFERNKTLSQLYKDLIHYRYHPLTPRDYIIINKANYVSRIIPTFQPRDYFLYYFCCKILEDEIAVNRVSGTYGGWRLGNKIRLREEYDELDLIESAPSNSFDPFIWIQFWKDFQKKAFLANKTGKYEYIVKFDIANFYDNINISLLGKKLYLACPTSKDFYVDLLIHFLNNWNKKFEGYAKKTVGLPQDEISDCSRLLANFYLQDYDSFLKSVCDKESCKYLRYADDQLIYAKDEKSAKYILFEASKYLSKIGLNINTSKVKFFESATQFNQYWGFQIFELLGDEEDRLNINKGLKLYLDWKDGKIEFRDQSVLKRILGQDFTLFKPVLKHRLLSHLFDKDFVTSLQSWGLTKFYNHLSPIDKNILLKIIDEQIDEYHFNSFHYNVLMFYKKNNIPFNEGKIRKRIDELKI